MTAPAASLELASAGEWPDRPHLPGPPDPEPLPLDALPSVLRDHATSVARAAQVSPDMTVLLSLCAVSAAAAGKVEVRVDGAWVREWITLYGVLIADPGERKSAAYAAMTEALREWESEAARRVAPEYRAAVELADVAERRLRRRKDEAARGAATPEQVKDESRRHEEALRAVPALPQLLAQDSTPEALVRQMGEQGGRVAVMSPEGGPLQIADGRYSEGVARLEELAQAYEGEELRPRRIGRATRIVRRPALTLAVALQPSVLDTIRNGRSLRGQGIYGRIAWVLPASRVGDRVDSSEAPPLDTDAAERYAAMLRRLLEWGPVGVEEDGTPVPHVVTLSPEAAAAKRAFHYRLEPELAAGARLAGIRDWATKAVGRAIRIAVLLDLAARAGDDRPLVGEPVSGWAMQAAVRLCEALTTHALIVLSEIGMDTRTADLRYVLRRVRELPEGATVRDAYRAVDSRPSIAGADSPVEYLAELLDVLCDRGCIRLRPQPSTGGRPASPVVELHPSLRPTSVPTVPVRAAVEVVI